MTELGRTVDVRFIVFSFLGTGRKTCIAYPNYAWVKLKGSSLRVLALFLLLNCTIY